MLSFAVVGGLVVGVTVVLGAWAIRSMLPQPGAEPDRPASVDSVTVGTRPAWLAPGAVRTVQLVIELRTDRDVITASAARQFTDYIRIRP